MRWLHYYLRLLAAASLLLIAAGGLVTSTDSGLAVPDWPNTYGYFMFAFPFSKMVGGILYEHGHRLIASVVGLLTIGLAVWAWRVETRAWVRRLAWTALAAVVAQGLLGGITVIYLLPKPISISHAGLAQLFFALVVSLGVFTSPGWRAGFGRSEPLDDPLLARLALVVPAFVYVQILLGATMRHNDAGLAIPDFPLAFGRLLPPEWSLGISLHFAHRVGAVAVTVAAVALIVRVLRAHRRRPELARPALLLGAVLLAQIGLGAWTVWSGLQPHINTAHVATGGLLWVVSVALALRVHRAWSGDASAIRASRFATSTGDAPGRVPA
ncbi:MAG: heme A synthase [Holophagales bacterium]|nr:heme A synthase [Holophagales bacterium]MYC10542.1 heme A synthase [Holophagales bacterium]